MFLIQLTNNFNLIIILSIIIFRLLDYYLDNFKINRNKKQSTLVIYLNY